MRPSLVIISISVFASLTACSGTESQAQRAVIQSLKDPDSAKFGKFTEFGRDTACIGVNAKNSMGGYTGEQQALMVKKSGAWNVLVISEQTHQECIDVASNEKDMKSIIEKFKKL